MIDRIQARRDALAQQLAQAQAQYDQLESTLKRLDRQLCAMQGGLQELDALIAAAEAPAVNGLDALLADPTMAAAALA